MSERAVIATMMSVTEIAHAGHVAVTVGAVLAAVAAVIAVVVADVVAEHHAVADGNHFFSSNLSPAESSIICRALHGQHLFNKQNIN